MNDQTTTRLIEAIEKLNEQLATLNERLAALDELDEDIADAVVEGLRSLSG